MHTYEMLKLLHAKINKKKKFKKMKHLCCMCGVGNLAGLSMYARAWMCSGETTARAAVACVVGFLQIRELSCQPK